MIAVTPIMDALWDGTICMCEGCGVHDPQVKELLSLMNRNRAALDAELTPKQRELFGKYMDHAEDYLLAMTRCAFRDGFSLAAGLLTEALGTAQ